MMAEPGSGKSYFINCLASHMGKENVSAVTYNMATLTNIEDLIQPLENVRNLKVVDKLPLLFLDEFDSTVENYSLLLPLLWDGELHLGRANLKLGKIVIILAGSDSSLQRVMNDAKIMNKTKIEGPKKLPDLLSRINGGVFRIPSLDIITKNRDSRVEKICLAIALLQKRFGPELELAPWSLLNFVANLGFRYGVRSIAHLIEAISCDYKIDVTLSPEKVKLPLGTARELRNSSLAYHLIFSAEFNDTSHIDIDKDEKLKKDDKEQSVKDNANSIIDYWKKIKNCKTLIRIQEKKDQDDYI